MKSTTCCAVAFAVALALFPSPPAVHATPVSPQESSIESALLELVSQLLDNMMTNSLLDRELEREGADAIPGIAVPPGAIQNRSMHNLSMDFGADTIRSKLFASGRFHVVAPPSTACQPIGLSVADPNTQFPDMNPFPAANYWLSGTIDEFRDASRIHFRLIMQIVDKRSNLIVWSDEGNLFLEK
jgi:hypothetical protein